MAIAVFTAHFGGDDVAVGTSAALLHTSGPEASAATPEILIIQNSDATDDTTIGASNVADGSNGIILVGGANNSITLTFRFPGIEVWVVGDATHTIQVLRA